MAHKTRKLSLLVAAAIMGALILLAVQTGIIRPMTSNMSPAVATTEGAGSKAKQIFTCSMHPQVIQDHPGNCPICHMKLTPLQSSRSDEDDKEIPPSEAGPVVRIDPTIVQNMGVRTADVMHGPLHVTVRAVGILEAPEPSTYEVNLKINGWIQKLYADTEGMHVHKGEPLFDLYSPDLMIAAQELAAAIKGLKSLDASASDAVRGESLQMVDSSKQKMRLWGIAEEDIDAVINSTVIPQTITFRSPVDGDLVEKTVVAGSAVQSGMKLMRIEDHSKLWLNVQVYEDQVPFVAIGQMVDAAIDGAPGKTFSGPIIFIAPHIDHMSRTAMVRVQLANTDHKLRPGMYATANIMTEPVSDAITVPREAVIDTGTRQIAFVDDLNGRFTPRNVRMGVMGDEDRVQILEGLAAGEKVVTSGQFLMDVESRTTEAIDKLRAKPTPETPKASPPMGEMNAMTPPAAPMGLTVAHCPMKNADWLQIGDTIVNPYYGTAMSTCGSATKKFPAPVEGTPLDTVTDNYLLVSKAFDADRFDTTAIQALKLSAAKLTGEVNVPLQQSTTALADAKDLESARTAFQQVSANLIRALEQASK